MFTVQWINSLSHFIACLFTSLEYLQLEQLDLIRLFVNAERCLLQRPPSLDLLEAPEMIAIRGKTARTLSKPMLLAMEEDREKML